MTNKQLIKNWKNLSIKFPNRRKLLNMAKTFMICWGESEMENITTNQKIPVVCFDTGGAQGSPALFCHSDKEDNCWSVGWNTKTNSLEDRVFGQFVKNEKKKTSKKLS